MARYRVDQKLPERPMTVFVWTDRTVALMEYTGKGRFVSRTPDEAVDRTADVRYWEQAGTEPIWKLFRREEEDEEEE